MDKKDFITETMFQLITTRQDIPVRGITGDTERLLDITKSIKAVADEIFGNEDEAEPLPEVGDIDFDKEPIRKLADEIEKLECIKAREKENRWGFPGQKGGINIRILNAFGNEEIYTVGEMLRVGRNGVMRIQNIGKKTIDLIDEALENLYGIKKW